MDKTVIIFSGMPASGKDTITEKLTQTDKQFVYLKKYRSVGKNDKLKNTYYNVSEQEFLDKIKSGDFLQYHKRYGRFYGIDKLTCRQMFEQNIIPVIHIGRIENYYTFCENIPDFEKQYNYTIRPVHIQLWETKEVLAERITGRDKTHEEIEKRLQAMNQEFEDAKKLMFENSRPFTAVVKNSNADETCRKIIAVANGSCDYDDGYKEFFEYLKTI